MAVAGDIPGGFSRDGQRHFGRHVGRNRDGQMKIIERISTVELGGNRTPDCREENLGLRQIARSGFDENLAEAGFQRFDAHEFSRDDLDRRGAPGVGPSLVGLVFDVPRLGGDGGTGLDHVEPAPVAVGGHQVERAAIFTRVVKRFQKIDGGIDAACHAPGFDKARHRRATV